MTNTAKLSFTFLTTYTSAVCIAGSFIAHKTVYRLVSCIYRKSLIKIYTSFQECKLGISLFEFLSPMKLWHISYPSLGIYSFYVLYKTDYDAAALKPL